MRRSSADTQIDEDVHSAKFAVLVCAAAVLALCQVCVSCFDQCLDCCASLRILAQQTQSKHSSVQQGLLNLECG